VRTHRALTAHSKYGPAQPTGHVEPQTPTKPALTQGAGLVQWTAPAPFVLAARAAPAPLGAIGCPLNPPGELLAAPTFNVSILFSHVSMVAPTLNTSIAFCMLWGNAEQQNGFPGSAHIQHFYCILHALRRCRTTNSISWECQHSTSLLRFTCFRKMPSNKLDSMGANFERFY